MLFHATPRPTVQATSHVGAKADNAPVDPFSDPFGDRRAEKQTPFANAAKARQNAERPLFKLTEWESESRPNSSEATIQRTNWNTSASDAIERTAPPQRLNIGFNDTTNQPAQLSQRPANLFTSPVGPNSQQPTRIQPPTEALPVSNTGTSAAPTHRMARASELHTAMPRMSPPPTPIRNAMAPKQPTASDATPHARQTALNAARPHKTIRQVSEVQVDDPLRNEELFQTPQLQSPSELENLDQLPDADAEQFSTEPPTTRSEIVPPRNESLFEPIQPIQPSIESPLQPDDPAPSSATPRNPRPSTMPPRLDRLPPRDVNANPAAPNTQGDEPLESMLNLGPVQPEPTENASPFLDDPPTQPLPETTPTQPESFNPDPEPFNPDPEPFTPNPEPSVPQSQDTGVEDFPTQDPVPQNTLPQDPFEVPSEPLQIPDDFAPVDPPTQDLPPSNDFRTVPESQPQATPPIQEDSTPELDLDSPYSPPENQDDDLFLADDDDDQDRSASDDVPCDRKYNDRNCCQEENECVKVLDRIRQRTIQSITVDITPPYEVSDDDPADVMQRKQDKLAQVPAREWYDRSGNLITTGTLKDMRRGKVILAGDQGEISMRLQELGRDEICYVTSYWNLPAECPLPSGDYAARNYSQITYAWTASAVCHKPLWFEDVALERYGHSAGPVKQSLFSAAHFFGSAILLPYNSRLYPPNECRYALGYYQPGDCAPWLLHAFPLSKRAAAGELLTILGIWGYVQ